MAKMTGRPAKYGYEDLARAVAQAEADFGTPSASQVKVTLCAQLGIATTLNDASFQAALAQVYSDRETARQKSVIAALPEGVRTSAAEQVRGPLEHAILLMLGESHATVKADAERRVAEAEQMTRDVTFRLRHLEAENAAIGADRDAKKARVQELESEVADLQQRVAEQACAAEAENRVFETIGRALTGVTASEEQKAQVAALLYSMPNRASDAA